MREWYDTHRRLASRAPGDLFWWGFGTNCSAGGCVVSIGPVDQWYIAGSMFAYNVAGASGVAFGEASVRPHVTAPEPATLALIALAMGSLVMLRRRARTFLPPCR